MLAASTIPSIHYNTKLPYIHHLVLNTTSEPRTRKPAAAVSSFRYNYNNHHHGLFFFKPRTYAVGTVRARAGNDDGASDAIPQQSSSVVSFSIRFLLVSISNFSNTSWIWFWWGRDSLGNTLLVVALFIVIMRYWQWGIWITCESNDDFLLKTWSESKDCHC